jgi:hypothetical protein
MVVVAGVTLIDAGGVTVTVACEESVGVSTLVAVTVAVVFAFTVDGAEYNPFEEIEPGPDTVQFTVAFVIPLSCAANCFVVPAATVVLVGETAMVSGVNVTDVEALAVAEAELLAVIVAVAFEVTVAGAV